jgi:monothiol bacilliredoxin
LPGIIDVNTEAALVEAVSSPCALIYKHSDRCWISHTAQREVSKFRAEFPDTPVYQIDVVGARALSQRAADLLGIPHASPQAIFVCEGKPVWVATHGSVRAKRMATTAAACSPEL